MLRRAAVLAARDLSGHDDIITHACVEAIPFESPNLFEVHQILLAMNGTYILENMDTAALAADKGYEFLFVLGQPRWAGGVQGMINPIAIR